MDKTSNDVPGFFLDIETDALLKEVNLGEGPGERGYYCYQRRASFAKETPLVYKTNML